MSVDRIQRLLRLISLLQSSSDTSVTDLMSELEVSRRTLFRYLKMLQNAGIPIHYDAELGYRIDQSFFLPPLSLTVSETLALLHLSKSALVNPTLPHRSPALSALNKLAATAPQPIRQACEDLMAHVSINHGAQEVIDHLETKHYVTLQQCIDQQQACQIQYQSPVESDMLDCQLHPYALHFASQAWYVLGWTNIHQQVRVFRLSRFISLKPIKMYFSPPKDFQAQDYLGKAWQLIPEGKVYPIELEFSAKVATNVSEVHWHPTQQHHILDDGRCIMTFEIDGIREIAWWLCGYADQVFIHKPDQLRQRVQEMLQAALDQYTPSKPAKEKPSKLRKQLQELAQASQASDIPEPVTYGSPLTESMKEESDRS